MPRQTSRDNPNQLKMFMTPTEVVSQYQPLEGDREEVMSDSARAWERTNRTHTTMGMSNQFDPPTTSKPRGQYSYAPGEGSYIRPDRMETDSELWGRKREESQMDPSDYAEYRGESSPKHFDVEAALERPSAPQQPGSNAGGSTWDSHDWHQHSYLNRKAEDWDIANTNRPSLYESVAQSGVSKPIHLATEQPGPTGKQEIIGGHHRIAAALESRPHDYMPVEHAPTLAHAQFGVPKEDLSRSRLSKGMLPSYT